MRGIKSRGDYNCISFNKDNHKDGDEYDRRELKKCKYLSDS